MLTKILEAYEWQGVMTVSGWLRHSVSLRNENIGYSRVNGPITGSAAVLNSVKDDFGFKENMYFSDVPKTETP